MREAFVRPSRIVSRHGHGWPGRVGLTLVELLVVLAVVGVLLGLLVPAVFSAREAARRTACQSNLRNLGFAAGMYRDTHHKLPPRDVWAVELLPFLEAKEIHKAWKRDPKAPLPRPKIFVCPSAQQGDSTDSRIPAAHYVRRAHLIQDAPQGCQRPWFPGPWLTWDEVKHRTSDGPHAGGRYNVAFPDGAVRTRPNRKGHW